MSQDRLESNLQNLVHQATEVRDTLALSFDITIDRAEGNGQSADGRELPRHCVHFKKRDDESIIMACIVRCSPADHDAIEIGGQEVLELIPAWANMQLFFLVCDERVYIYRAVHRVGEDLETILEDSGSEVSTLLEYVRHNELALAKITRQQSQQDNTSANL